MIPPLSPRQLEVLRFVRQELRDKGIAPTLKEIAFALGVRADSTVHKHLEQLERKGYLRRRWNNARGITLISRDGCCPTCGQDLPKEAKSA